MRKSLIIDAVQIRTPYRISVTIRNTKQLYLHTIFKLNMKNYFILQIIQSYHCYLFKCNSLVLIFKILNI